MNENRLIQNLQAHGFEVLVYSTPEEAVRALCAALSGKTIGIGGSLTVREIGLDQALLAHSTVYWHWLPEQAAARGGADAVRALANGAEVYISSANAISETGELVNIDGTGNRIAATAYGHQQVIFVAGMNKVAESLDAAIWRARNVAAPKNAQRLKRNTPCAKLADRCYDCNSPERICNGLLVLARPMGGMKTTVVLIRTELGA